MRSCSERLCLNYPATPSPFSIPMPTRVVAASAHNSCMRPPNGHNCRAITSSLSVLLPRNIWRSYSTLFGIKKDATSAPPKCLHNRIILIVYILQIYADNLFVFGWLYNNAAKIFGAEDVLCRRLEILVVKWIYKASWKY